MTVNDTEKPVLTVPASKTVGNDPGLCEATVDPGTAMATDNCPGVKVTGVRSDGQPLSAVYDHGTTTITWTATDAAGNSTTGTQTITVKDVEAPVISIATAVKQLWPPNQKFVAYWW